LITKYGERKKQIEDLEEENGQQKSKLEELTNKVTYLESKIVKRADGSFYSQEEITQLENDRQKKNILEGEVEALKIYPVRVEELQTDLEKLVRVILTIQGNPALENE